MNRKPLCRNPWCRAELMPWKHPLGLCPSCYLIGRLAFAAGVIGAVLLGLAML